MKTRLQRCQERYQAQGRRREERSRRTLGKMRNVKFEAQGPALDYVVPPESGSVGVCWALDDLRLLPTWAGVRGAWMGRGRGWTLLQLVAHTNGPGLFAPEEVPCAQGSVRWEADHRSVSPEKSL